eukprot:349634-Chlamydomonas_euryale.AAC.4
MREDGGRWVCSTNGQVGSNESIWQRLVRGRTCITKGRVGSWSNERIWQRLVRGRTCSTKGRVGSINRIWQRTGGCAAPRDGTKGWVGSAKTAGGGRASALLPPPLLVLVLLLTCCVVAVAMTLRRGCCFSGRCKRFLKYKLLRDNWRAGGRHGREKQCYGCKHTHGLDPLHRWVATMQRWCKRGGEGARGSAALMQARREGSSTKRFIGSTCTCLTCCNDARRSMPSRRYSARPSTSSSSISSIALSSVPLRDIPVLVIWLGTPWCTPHERHSYSTRTLIKELSGDHSLTCAEPHRPPALRRLVPRVLRQCKVLSGGTFRTARADTSTAGSVLRQCAALQCTWPAEGTC